MVQSEYQIREQAKKRLRVGGMELEKGRGNASSLRAQSLPDIEVLLVDDGSTDGSAEILHRAAEGSRFQMIHQENQGVPPCVIEEPERRLPPMSGV